MKIEKKHWIIIAVIVAIIIIWYSNKKKKEAESAWWIFSKKPIQVTTPDKTASGCVNCWVSTVEDGVQYCRWYDNYGRNTQSYAGRSCTGTQANMGGVNQGYGANYGKRRPWWASLFGR
jgi:uncharacterized protein YodC (DUF2158 family)